MGRQSSKQHCRSVDSCSIQSTNVSEDAFNNSSPEDVAALWVFQGRWMIVSNQTMAQKQPSTRVPDVLRQEDIPLLRWASPESAPPVESPCGPPPGLVHGLGQPQEHEQRAETNDCLDNYKSSSISDGFLLADRDGAQVIQEKHLQQFASSPIKLHVTRNEFKQASLNHSQICKKRVPDEHFAGVVFML
jgi:hypothetical protein